MLINFLNPKCKPIAHSTVPCSEGYEINNLIISENEVVHRGFLAYSCIRPPVDIEFNLICCVNLNYILIESTVGAQKSTGFEILIKNKSTQFYQTVCVCYLNDNEVGLVCYNARTFQPDKMNSRNNYKFCAMKSSQWRLFTTCDKVKVRVLKTRNSVPCIGKIQVWGFISKACSSNKKHQVLEMCALKSNCENQEDISNFETAIIEDPEENLERIANPVNKGDGIIPEEFLDSITYEVMCLPMTLPSGNTVDQSTIDKHINSQEIWCRKPFDPFTGQIFTETCKPIFNASLKHRIDQFLVQNQDLSCIKNLPRTLGTSTMYPQIKGLPDSQQQPIEKPQQTESKKRSYSEAMDYSPQLENSNTESSLDIILNNTLSKLKRFTTLTPPLVCDETNQKACVLCNTSDSLYILNKCEHLYCRQCLINSLSNQCLKCNLHFIKSDVNRYHIS